MKRSITLAIVLVLAGLGLGVLWLLSGGVAAGSSEPVEIPRETQLASPRTANNPVELLFPSAPAFLEDEPTPPKPEVSSQRRPARPPPPPDYAARYRDWPFLKLSERATTLEASLKSAQSARFDALQARFDQLFEAREYGARITEVGRAFEGVEFKLGRQQAYSARTVELPNGSFVMHVLEFCPAEEPATAHLVEELAWLRCKLKP
ncbi:MAG TPA: hypothetical protein VK843_19370 [Planctomycetota bacterium]|nr:hypothetical protein [Planctomycetota bacterium]